MKAKEATRKATLINNKKISATPIKHIISKINEAVNNGEFFIYTKLDGLEFEKLELEGYCVRYCEDSCEVSWFPNDVK